MKKGYDKQYFAYRSSINIQNGLAETSSLDLF